MCRDGHVREWFFRPAQNGAYGTSRRKKRGRLKCSDDYDDDNGDVKLPPRRSTRARSSL